MHLIVDIGNSKVKTALFSGEELADSWQGDSLGPEKLQQWIGDRPVTAALYADVRHSHPALTTFLHQHYHTIALSHNTPLPITLDYQTPETLGRDRIAGAVAAHHRFPDYHVLVIDMGTSITYDFTTRAGHFLGGQIVPGMHMRWKALHTFTGGLPQVSYERDIPHIGHSTITSIQSGVVWGIVHEIEGFISQYQSQYHDLKVILTGGDAPLFVSKLKSQIFADAQLVVRGLNKILQYNVELDR